MTPDFEKNLEKITAAADGYLSYSPTQIARGDDLKDDPALGERSWRIPETTGQFLYEIIRTLDLKTGLELGTSTGYSAFWISSALYENDPSFTLITIEQSKPKYEVAVKLFSEIPYSKNISFINTEILNILKDLDDTFDFIFMDADRGNYENYWPYIKNLLNKKSIVAIDNAFINKPSMQLFLEKISTDATLSTLLHPLDNGLFLVVLKDGANSDLHKIISHALQNIHHR